MYVKICKEDRFCIVFLPQWDKQRQTHIHTHTHKRNRENVGSYGYDYYLDLGDSIQMYAHVQTHQNV